MRLYAGVLSLALMAAVSGSSLAAKAPPKPGAKPTPAPVAWTVDKAASRLGFHAAMNDTAFDGMFRRWEANIVFDPANLAASHVTATVETGSAITGDPTRDEALPTADWFFVQKFPKATFIAKTFKALGPNRYEADGDLTIRGVTRPAALPFNLTITGKVAKIDGQLVIDRSQFGVGQGQWKAGDAVKLPVTVTVKLQAVRAR